MRKKLHILFCLVSLNLVFGSFTVLAQESNGSEEMIIAQADRDFKDENYEQALAQYSKLLSIHPHDVVYTYRIGVSMVALNQDLSRAIDYLREVLPSSAEIPLAYYYLARALQLQYQFDDAISNYSIFKEKGSSSQVRKLEIDRQISYCNNAKSIMSELNDLYVYQKKDVNFSGFFRSYDFNKIQGSIITISDDFKSAEDRRSENPNAVMYILPKRDRIIFSSYGSNGSNGKDIFEVTKTIDGKWSEPKSLGSEINSTLDEDFPYLMPDGVTLYFCSNGHNSIGGYDIFKSIFNPSTNQWSTPENLNFAINTPYDEYLYIPDSTGRFVSFSSNRTSTIGQISLFKVRLDKHPISEKTVTFSEVEVIKTEKPEEYKQAIAEITKKAALNVNVSEDSDIDYSGDEKQSEIGLIDINEVEASKARSRMQNRKVYQTRDNKNPIEINEKSTNADIINASKIEALNLQDEVDELAFKADAANAIAKDKNQEAIEKFKEADDIDKKANTLTDEAQKTAMQNKASRIRTEAETMKKEAAIAYNMATELEKSVSLKKNEAKDAFSFANELESALKSGSPENAIAMLDEYSKKLEASYVDYDEKVINAQTPNQQDYDDKMFEVETLKKEYEKLKEEATSMRSDADKIRMDADKSKKKATKEQLLQQAALIDEDIKDVELKAETANQKVQFAQAQADSIYYNLTVINEVFAEISTSADSTKISGNQDVGTSVEQKFSKSSFNAGAPVLAAAKPKDQQKKAVVSNSGNKKVPTDNTDVKREKLYASIKAEAQSAVSKVETSIRDAQSLADAALLTSSNKSKQAADLISKAEAASVQEAAQMRFQASKLNEEADLSMGIFKMVQNSIEKLKLLQEELSDNYISIEKDLAENNSEQAQSLVNSQKNKISENENTKPLKSDELLNNLSSDFIDQSNSKEQEAKTIEIEVKGLQEEADTLKSEKDSKKTSKKRKLDIDNRLTEIDGIIVQKNNQVTSLITESQQFRSKAEKAKAPNQLSADIANITGKVNVNEVAFIDKTTLQDNIGRVDNYFVEHPEYKIEPVLDTELPIQPEVVAEVNEVPPIETKEETKIATKEEEVPAEKIAVQPENPVQKTVVKEDVKSIKQFEESQAQTQEKKEEMKLEVKEEPPIVVAENQNVVQSEPEVVRSEVVSPSNDLSAELTELQNLNNSLFSQYQMGLNGLEIVRISIEPTIYEKYTNIEPIYTAAQIEKEADNLSTKANENVSRFQMSGDVDEKKALLLQAVEWRNLALENQKRAIELYKQSRDQKIVPNEPVAVKEDVSVKPEVAKETIVQQEEFPAKKEIVAESVVSQKEVFSQDTYLVDKQSIESADKSGLSNDAVALVNDYLNDADNYYQSSQKKREEAALEQNPEKKEVLLHAAEVEAKIASEKQANAKKILSGEISDAEIIQKSVEEDEKEGDKVLTPLESDLVAESPSAEIVTVKSSDLEKPQMQVVEEKPVIEQKNPEVIIKTEPVVANESSVAMGNSNNQNIESSPRSIPEIDVLFDKKVYEGIIFKVQLIAYKGSPNYSLFNNIEPMSYEETGTGFTRYMAGVFSNYDIAEKAQQDIKIKGFPSAYVVAYRDGKRININEARETFAKGEGKSVVLQSIYNVSSGRKYDVVNATKASPVTGAESTGTNMASLSGLIYSVQVAVYAKPTDIGARFNIPNMLFDKMGDGRYRYLNGSFKTRNEASQYKLNMISKGFKDAYVVVYYNGKKVTLNEAAQIEKQ